MPAVVDTDEGGLFVTKFRGAGQGAPALVAELVVGALAQAAGLPVPDLALIELDAAFGRTEPDPEIQDILRSSHGLNVGLRYLEGAFPYDPVATPDLVSPELAADLVWFDAYTTNVDRTPRNPNLLIWQRALQLIDHGAAIYVHHNWSNFDADRIHAPFPPIHDHVLLPHAGDLEAADARMTDRLDASVVREVLAAHGLDRADGRTLLLAQPRMLGHVFNPVSFWLCHGRDGTLRAVIAEVSNTFGDRHSYLVHRADMAPIGPRDRLQARKIFHVSPFLPIAGGYSFRFDIRADRIGVWIDWRGAEERLYATLTGRRRPLTNRAILRSALRRPLGPRRVLGLIHWQALKLWWKGGRWHGRPAPPAKEVSR